MRDEKIMKQSENISNHLFSNFIINKRHFNHRVQFNIFRIIFIVYLLFWCLFYIDVSKFFYLSPVFCHVFKVASYICRIYHKLLNYSLLFEHLNCLHSVIINKSLINILNYILHVPWIISLEQIPRLWIHQ